MGLASNAVRTLGTQANAYGGDASGIAGSLVPFATRQLLNPQGYSPQDLTAQLSSASAGAGGATSGIVGNLDQTAASTNNYGGFAGAADEASRQRMKAAAGSAEGIAANNADVKLSQQKNAANILSSTYGTDIGAQSSADSAQQDAIKSAQSEGFMARLQQITGMLAGGASSAAGVIKALK